MRPSSRAYLEEYTILQLRDEWEFNVFDFSVNFGGIIDAVNLPANSINGIENTDLAGCIVQNPVLSTWARQFRERPRWIIMARLAITKARRR